MVISMQFLLNFIKGLFIGIGAILPGISSGNSKKASSYFSFFICFFVGISLIYIENHFTVSNEYFQNNYSFLFLVLSGFFMSIGIVVPRSK